MAIRQGKLLRATVYILHLGNDECTVQDYFHISNLWGKSRQVQSAIQEISVMEEKEGRWWSREKPQPGNALHTR